MGTRRRAQGEDVRHGHTSGGKTTPTYFCWHDMIKRCLSKTHRDYQNYGARGISVCKRWESFENFLADMGEKPIGMTIERIDNNNGYFHDNCRWATLAEQNRNTRSNVFLTFNGRTLCQAEWERELGMNLNTLGCRIRAGWSIERAFTEPVHLIHKQKPS